MRFSRVLANRGRHPGQGSRDPEVPARKCWTGTETYNKIRDWDQDSNSKFAGFGTGTKIWKNLGPGTGTGTHNSKIRDPGPRLFGRGFPGLSGDWKNQGHDPGPVPTPARISRHSSFPEIFIFINFANMSVLLKKLLIESSLTWFWSSLCHRVAFEGKLGLWVEVL